MKIYSNKEFSQLPKVFFEREQAEAASSDERLKGKVEDVETKSKDVELEQETRQGEEEQLGILEVLRTEGTKVL